ncbi:MAG: hypothetical protein B0D96_01135 [Candidatus Sedimenticola endophacoides]|uniref:Cytochrome c-552/4 domain-containing protein n=1 Tax=Candidatus Sedimenticola endophacoides TaxID=2548426 RepID=A0A657Q1F5_9GAMM|nr:MAG: hypothetical protein B0D84_02745 [Candidatus Sedimenticola endophacoides]OQX37912.1 MAG: hypothetical protein B0D96_01135 [Candidatus Sedimenticola endophacoides]OQX39005.1 MAG: hypothetical protein B0D89_11655 [Candidatus Sedimenticola endophacoides]OQX42545.1 MAG: hypothetical protein B0D82_00820 [Candidatus Sedimenticola endophacoides]OQX42608.1 MAG: hypothetical protein B0D88_06355 [Candidatus Sedimenticola endophacoides]
MNKPVFSRALRLLPFGVLLVACASPVVAAKVTIDSSNWGLEAGKECVSCHKKSSAGLAKQWQESAHHDAGVNCLDCHQADSGDDDAVEHEGAVVATIVSPRDCGRCHTAELKQHAGSVHANAVALIADRMPAMAENLGGPALVAAGCAQCHGSTVKVKGDGTLDPETWPNTGIGRINPDGSKGSCSACHARHAFSKAQARDPSACARCHSGPDSPDKEVYEASKHGMLFKAHNAEMNLDSDEWVAGKDYTAAPTCVTCHMGAAPGLNPSHDVGMRGMWNLNSPVSEKQYLVVFEDGDTMELPDSEAAPRRGSEIEKPDGTLGIVKVVATPERRRKAMSKVCLECHGKDFVQGAMRQFDDLVELYNDKFGRPAQNIMLALYERGVLTPAPFDEPLEFTYWELWHDEGARARHGAAMASPNHTWWEGLYQVSRNFYSKFLPQVRQVAGEQAQALITAHLEEGVGHGWLKSPEKGSRILGYRRGEGQDD